MRKCKSPYKKLHAVVFIMCITAVALLYVLFHKKESAHQHPVQAIYSYQTAHAIAAQVHEGTLVLFDVDDTLITSPIHANYFSWWFKALFILMHPTFINMDWENAYSLMWKNAPFKLIDPLAIGFIKTLKDNGATVLGLTSMESGGYGVIESMPEWRYVMLNSMGIEFSQQYADTVFASCPAYRSNHPALYKGILCANQQNKGAVLKAFLNYSKFVPSHIIAFDDSLDALQSIGTVCEELNIRYTLIHYRRADILPNTWNTWRALKQFEYLITEHRWVGAEL